MTTTTVPTTPAAPVAPLLPSTLPHTRADWQAWITTLHVIGRAASRHVTDTGRRVTIVGIVDLLDEVAAKRAVHPNAFARQDELAILADMMGGEW